MDLRAIYEVKVGFKILPVGGKVRKRVSGLCSHERIGDAGGRLPPLCVCMHGGGDAGD